MEALQTTGVAGWLREVRFEVDRHIAEALREPHDEGGDAAWSRCREVMAEYSLRPAKRIRAALLLTAFALTRRRPGFVPALYRFAAGVELLHTFMLVHDDVADHAATRRSGTALHLLLDEDRAIVAGDYMFARAMEVMLSAPLTHACGVTKYYLQICRETAAGQYLDLQLQRVPLAHVSLFQTMKVAQLKTARYGFVAPLVAGAKLADGSAETLALLERIGRLIGLSYQFVDDLIGMFGESSTAGKPTDSDYLEGKRTFPVIAAYARADAAQKEQLEQLWDTPHPAQLEQARALLIATGGKAATERVIASSHRAARALIARLPSEGGYRNFLIGLLEQLAARTA